MIQRMHFGMSNEIHKSPDGSSPPLCIREDQEPTIMSRTTYARRKKPKRKKSDDILERKGEKIKKKNNWIDVLTFKFFTPPPIQHVRKGEQQGWGGQRDPCSGTMRNNTVDVMDIFYVNVKNQKDNMSNPPTISRKFQNKDNKTKIYVAYRLTKSKHSFPPPPTHVYHGIIYKMKEKRNREREMYTVRPELYRDSCYIVQSGRVCMLECNKPPQALLRWLERYKIYIKRKKKK